MPAWLIALIPVIAPYVMHALMAGLPLALTYLVHKFVKNKTLADALQHAEDAAGPVVRSVAQTYVDDIAAAAADGKLTQDEQDAALQHALNALIASIPPQYLSVLEAAFGDRLDEFLKVQIEAAVQALKVEKQAAFVAIPGLTNEKASVN